MAKHMIVALAALVVLCSLTPPVHADFVYSNGSLSNGTNGAWNINGSDAVSDSFTLTSTTTLTSALLGIWVSEGQAPTSVNWSIGTSQFGSNLGSGVNASLTNVFEYNNPYLSSTYSIYDSTFSLDVVLGPGTYWLTISGGQNNGGPFMGWDENFGPSAAYQNSEGRVGSEFFQLDGTGMTAAPAPSSFGLLVVGAISMAGYGWRRLRKMALKDLTQRSLVQTI